jgi:vanillate O-demethylase monooxygenase subunit
VANYPKGVDKAPPGFRWLRHFRCHAPFSATLEVHFPGADRLVILNAAFAGFRARDRLFVPIARNFDTDQPVQGVYDFNRQVFEEDAAMVEAQHRTCAAGPGGRRASGRRHELDVLPPRAEGYGIARGLKG